jgi:hypothetical protein
VHGCVSRRASWSLAKRAVYLEEAHVDCAAFWVVIHDGRAVSTRRLSAVGLWERGRVAEFRGGGGSGAQSDVTVGTWGLLGCARVVLETCDLCWR